MLVPGCAAALVPWAEAPGDVPVVGLALWGPCEPVWHLPILQLPWGRAGQQCWVCTAWEHLCLCTFRPGRLPLPPSLLLLPWLGPRCVIVLLLIEHHLHLVI